MPAPGDNVPVYRTLPPWTDDEIAFRASIFSVDIPRAEWVRRPSRVVLRSARAEVEFYRGRRSLRWRPAPGVATPTYGGADVFDALAALTGGRHEPLLPRATALSAAAYTVNPPRVTRVSAAGVGTTSVTGRSLGARFSLNASPLWRMRLRVDLDLSDRVTSLFLFASDVEPAPALTVSTLTLAELFDALAPGLRVLDTEVEGPGYLLATPDRAQPLLAPVYRLASSDPNRPSVRFCTAFSHHAPSFDGSWVAPYEGDVTLI